jgi:streptomycin 3"-adenylyltransferase
LATGCFNPACSDLDLLVVLHRDLILAARQHLAKLMLAHSRSPMPLEISVLRLDELRPWRHPTPYIFHYSEGWRERFVQALAGGEGAGDDALGKVGDGLDEDLAAHITITHHRGICLWGAAIADVFPQVPAGDYAASIVSDLYWARERLDQYPVYAVLNICRVYAYLRDGLICSKREGADWALEALPGELRCVVGEALAVYIGAKGEAVFEPRLLTQFVAYLVERVAELYPPLPAGSAHS